MGPIRLERIELKRSLLAIFAFLGMALFGVFLASTLFVQPAYASDCTGGPMCGGIDGGATGGSDGGGGTGGVYIPGPGDGGSGSTPKRDLLQFLGGGNGGSTAEVRCTNWGGSGSWTKDRVCNITSGSVKSAIAAKHGISASSVRQLAPVYDLVTTGTTCPVRADGRSAHSINIRYTIQEQRRTWTTYNWMWPIAWDFGFRGGWFGIPAYNSNLGTEIYSTHDGAPVAKYNIRHYSEGTGVYMVTASAVNCNYPQSTTAERFTCFFNYGGTAWFSTNKSEIGSGGTRTKVRSAEAGDPSAPVWNGNRNSAPSCGLSTKQVSSITVRITVDPDSTATGGGPSYKGYGYYRLSPSYKTREFTKTEWRIVGSQYFSNNQVVYSAWSSNYASNAAAPTRVVSTWYGYSCRAGIEGAFRSAGAIPNLNRYFAYGACPSVQPQWRCEIANPTTVGLSDAQHAALVGSSYSNRATVMRNGEKVPLRFSDIRIVDVRSGVDVTNGGGGSSIRNVSQIAYRDLVKEGSTPFLGSDPNASNQLFKLWPSMTSSSTDTWGSWKNNANSNVRKAISFNWSSDSSSGTFVAQRQWRVTAEFSVLRASGVISGDTNGGGGGSSRYEWVQDTQTCYERNGDGSFNTSRILTSNSNPVSVVRSVNNPDG